MPIRVKCEKCKKTLSVKDHLEGKKIKCPVCQGVVAVPMASPAKASPASAKPGTPKPGPAAPKKPVAAAKPAAKTKAKDDTNGTVPLPSGTNGKTPPPDPIELPPENVEEEALSALADEPPPPEESKAPTTIDFKCQWCDEEVKLPIELAGKQAQCPNPECKRIVKVPLPKTPEKKDWRKMERQGPAAAIVNMPEALDNAWGTEEATRARHDSLEKAGAIEKPARPPLGVFGWLQRGFYTIGIVALLSVAGVGVFRLSKSHEQHNVVEDIKQLLEGQQPKIQEPLLRAEAERTRAIYRLQGRDAKIYLAKKDFGAALSYIKFGDDGPSLDKPFIHEQFFLIDLALSQIECAGTGDDLLTKRRQDWEETRKNLVATLEKIKTPQIQVIALREIAARLDQQTGLKERRAMAIGLAGGLSAEVGGNKRPLAFRQQIALVYWDDKKLDAADEKDLDVAELNDGNLRVGFAEGYARKGKFDEAFKLANLKGPEEDKLDAFLGIAAVALLDKNKEKSAEALKAALEIAKDSKKITPTPWQWLEFSALGARLDENDAVKQAIEQMPPPFKLRARLEVFLAKCDKSTGPISTDELNDLVAEDKEGVTLALAWMALARQRHRLGARRSENLKIFDNYVSSSTIPTNVIDLMRPMVLIGTYQGLK